MNLSASLRHLAVLLSLLSFSAGLSSARAAEISDAPLVISGGQFTYDGKAQPATLKNLIEVVRLRYPAANITLVDVDDVRIDHLTLQWRSHTKIGPMGGPPRLISVLAAFAEASERRFEVSDFSDNDFLLRRPGGSPQSSKPTVRVFNLRGLGGRQAEITRELENSVQMAKAERVAMARRYVEKSPQLQDQDLLIQKLELQAAVSRQPAPNQDKVLNDIQEAVALALAQVAPAEKAPEFKYHAGTNLLIVTGSEVAVDTARMVIDALVKNP